MAKITREDILSIPDMAREGYSPNEVAKELGISRSTLSVWTKKLKDDGFEVPFKKGPRPIKLR